MLEATGNTVTSAVVYESLWGNTAEIAKAIAAGIGPGTAVLSTSQARGEVMSGVKLLVVGAPLLGFAVPNANMIKSIADNKGHAKQPDTSHMPMRTWLDELSEGKLRVAAFETRMRISPGSASKGVMKALEAKGYRPVGMERFIVTGRYGPLKAGETDRAKAWGAALADGTS